MQNYKGLERRYTIGVYIHNLKDKTGYPSAKGSNPFDHFTVDGRKMSEIVPCLILRHTTLIRIFAVNLNRGLIKLRESNSGIL